MKIEFVEYEGAICPVVKCDHCGEPIRWGGGDDWVYERDGRGPGLVAWPMDEYKEPSRIAFLHRGLCDDVYHSRHGELVRTAWRPLDQFLKQVLLNMTIPFEAERSAR